MSEERRYSEAEVEEILQRATEQRAGLPRGEGEETGLTLSEIKDIGGEVGIPADALERAARSLDQPRGVQRSLGLPLTVRHTVPLSRPLTDLEWERLVGELRETFRARGKIRQHGRLREWYNGNLHALVEPTEDGWRLRMGTTKGQSRALMAAGGVMLALVTLMTVLFFLGVAVDASELASLWGILAPVGGAMMAVGAAQLPGWARERRDQMEVIGTRVEEMTRELPAGDGRS